MPRDRNQHDRFDQLRQQAEALLTNRPRTVSEPPPDILELIHELHVHQAELEIQNEELQRAQLDLSLLHRKYEDLYEFAPCGYLTLSAKGTITNANLAAVELLGADKTQLSRTTLALRLAEESQGAYLEARGAVGASGEKQSHEARIKRGPAAPPLWVRVDIEADRDGDEAVICWRVVLVDITKRRLAEQAYADAESHLRQAQRQEATATLAGGAAHEINNPINGIMNYAQLLKDALDGKEERLAEYAECIVIEAERVAVIVKNLLSFAYQDQVTANSVEIGDLLESSLSLVRASLVREQIKLEENVAEDLPRIHCCGQLIQQVLMNLLSNAREALNRKYPGQDEDKKIIVRAECEMLNGVRCVRLTVEDHGPGIAAAARTQIFDPFYTTKDRSRGPDGHFGSGLGLAISHGIVSEHGGVLSVESKVGAYTRFHVDLPVSEGGRVAG